MISIETLNEITRRLVAEFKPEQIILFGSYAWGEPTPDSDLDLLVIVADSPLKPVRRAVLGHRCLAGLGVSKDILVRTITEVNSSKNVPSSFLKKIVEKGKILYGRSQTSGN